MRKVSIDLVEPGMILARNIYSAEGRTLLGAGITLSTPFITRLKELGVPALFIKDQTTGDLPVPDVISEQVRLSAVKTVRDSFTRVQLYHENGLDPTEVKEAASAIIDEVLRNRHVMVHMADIRTFDDYTFGHSVNVCVLSVLTGIAMGYNEFQLFDLACGAMLHDIGKMLVPLEVLNKPGRLTPEEFTEIRRHCEFGFEIIRQYKEQFSLFAAHVAYQHQERFDGSGYPRQLKGTEIHEYARIVAIADMYDALVADRIYRKGYLPYQAHEIILAASARELDPTISQIFLQNIAIYPIGSTVQLNTGDIGVVVDVNKIHQSRPVVRLIYDHSGKLLSRPYELDLTRHLTVFVEKVLFEDQVSQLISSSA
ncbi:HD-GYP domain-containing protein [Heliobacterium chlorum]|uniref:HD-GYP domain-containing protein n=1 Tax=Heliobacterium chlorum TaxID=2698 RepID=A0ABR7T1E7_HELCL|nr:HD-GYP domain-containing protein [Heliobacterium chlorum]MBC9784607.1 HD-GYP domain-containing protein [Heliobacterium chlorum]